MEQINNEKSPKFRKTKPRIKVAGLPAEEYYRNYFLEHREELYQRRKDRKFFCKACNREYAFQCKFLHLKTNKHIQAQELYDLKHPEEVEQEKKQESE